MIKVQTLICSLENINVVVLKIFLQNFGKFFCRLFDVFIPDLALLFLPYNIFYSRRCTCSMGRKTTLSRDAPTTMLDFSDSIPWVECLKFFCQMKTTHRWSKVSFWCHQTAKHFPNLKSLSRCA